jgi:hypothetical protein
MLGLITFPFRFPSIKVTSYWRFPILNVTYRATNLNTNPHPYRINMALQPNPLANIESFTSWNIDGGGGGGGGNGGLSVPHSSFNRHKMLYIIISTSLSFLS